MGAGAHARAHTHGLGKAVHVGGHSAPAAP
jgi:hypothetical protein